MDVGAVLVVAVAIFAWGVASSRLERADLGAPVVFVALGAVVARVGLVDSPSAPERLRPLVELTLVWVLFSDAARIPLREMRPDFGRYARLLGIGLPLTVLAGWGLAAWLFPDLDTWLLLLVAAALAPTDAALGVCVVTNPVVPAPVRRLITVESGLNDGIATPVVMLALAAAASAEGIASAPGPLEGLVELAVGALVGALAGVAGGRLLRVARRRGWAAEDFVGAGVLALAVASYAGAVTVHGNGFIAAFVGGVAFGASAGRRGAAEVSFLEQTSGLVSLLVWFAFGAIAGPIMVGRMDAAAVVYAVLSLTVIRMVPVALACLGAGLDRDTVLFVGWFGPRGLASLIFALLAVEELGPGADEVVTIIALTVLLSVVAHGFTAGPLAAWYGASERRRDIGPALPDLPVRGLPRRTTSRAGD